MERVDVLRVVYIIIIFIRMYIRGVGKLYV